MSDGPAEPWVERLALAVLGLMLLYVMFGVPGDDPTDTAQTDRVSPLNSFIWLGLLAMALPVLVRRWRNAARLALACWPLLLLYGYFALSVTWALDPPAAMRRVLFTVLQLALCAILIGGVRRAPLTHLVVAATCSAAALADVAAWIAAPGYAMTAEGFAGLQGQKNQTGLLIMYGCLAAVPGVFLVQGWLGRAALAASAVAMVVVLAATRSTTSESVVISAALVMPVLLLLARLPRRLILAVAAVALLAAGAGVLGDLAWCGVTGLDPMLPLRGATFTERIDIWNFVAGEIQKRPWLGAGYSSFWGINPDVQPSLKSDQWFSRYVVITEGHNGYLDQLATGGLVGLAGSLFVLFRTIGMAGHALGWTQGVRRFSRPDMLGQPTAVFHLSLGLGLIVHNFTESNLFANNGLLAVAFLICALDLEKWRMAVRADRRARGVC